MSGTPSDKALIVFKYGGNAMTDEALKRRALEAMFGFTRQGYDVVIVHGGGPFIQQQLDAAGLPSEFIGGHRKTSPEALAHVEMALKGLVNGSIVGIANTLGYSAVGLSGKDGHFATAVQRTHREERNDAVTEHDLGRVGDVSHVDTTLLRLLLERGYIPVATCIVPGENGEDYNVNADMFAGEIAGALQADVYAVLTDVDGLLEDKDDPATLIRELGIDDIDALIARGVIQGGMIPKIEACRIALTKGAKSARIVNGTKPEAIAALARESDRERTGTTIHGRKA